MQQKQLKHSMFYFNYSGPKLGNAAPASPQNHLSGPPKSFSWMVMQKSEPRRSVAKLEILRNSTLFWRLFVRFEPLKFLSFNKG